MADLLNVSLTVINKKPERVVFSGSKTTELAHSVVASTMTPSQSFLSISVAENCLVVGPAVGGTLCTLQTLPSDISMRCFAVFMLSSSTLNVFVTFSINFRNQWPRFSYLVAIVSSSCQ